MSKRRSGYYRQGVVVMLALAVLTGLEYAVALFTTSGILLMLIALFKAGLVVQYFMSVARLWSPEEEH
jgi:cytochrome c oxidase subunit IV